MNYKKWSQQGRREGDQGMVRSMEYSRKSPMMKISHNQYINLEFADQEDQEQEECLNLNLQRPY